MGAIRSTLWVAALWVTAVVASTATASPCGGGSQLPAPTPSPLPTRKATGGAVGDDCCDVTCGIIPALPCRDGLKCVAPEPTVEPGVVLDGWVGKCEGGGRGGSTYY